MNNTDTQFQHTDSPWHHCIALTIYIVAFSLLGTLLQIVPVQAESSNQPEFLSSTSQTSKTEVKQIQRLLKQEDVARIINIKILQNNKSENYYEIRLIDGKGHLKTLFANQEIKQIIWQRP